MAVTVFQFTHERASDFTKLLVGTPNRRALLRAVRDFMSGLNSGAFNGTIAERETTAVKASGTLTSTNAIATDAILINGVTFTCVASGATGDQWNLGADDAADCVNLAAAINASASALVNKHVTASASSNVVTITAKRAGHAGNAITLSSADATIVASGARLAGGSGDQASVNF